MRPKVIELQLGFSQIKEFDVLAVDQFLDRKQIAENIQPKKVIQGNLDPIFLTQKKDILMQELKEVTQDFKKHPYIFNLGHVYYRRNFY